MDFKNVGKLVVGVVVFLVVLQVLQMTNLMAFVADQGVESGKLQADSAPAATSLFEVGAALLSGVVFLLTRLGGAAIAFVTSLVGVNQAPVVNNTVAAKDDLRKELAFHLFNKALAGDKEAIKVFTEFIAGKPVFDEESK
jgi:hypothetical protein